MASTDSPSPRDCAESRKNSRPANSRATWPGTTRSALGWRVAARSCTPPNTRARPPWPGPLLVPATLLPSV